MNEDTLVAVHCYAGDKQQVENALPVFLHHECPVLVLSPEDSKVEIDHPGVECRWAGKRGYFGQDSLDRQRAHLEILASYPQKFFLLNDADSMCLSPKLPDYLYQEAEGTVFSNVVNETRPHASEYPKIAFHPPYFLTKDSIQRMLEVADRIKAHPITPFIDWYMVALTCEAGLQYKGFPDGRSLMAWRHGKEPGTIERGHDYVVVNDPRGPRNGGEIMRQFVERGIVLIHAVKHKEVLTKLVNAHAVYERRMAARHR
jgi:hypothetical protein